MRHQICTPRLDALARHQGLEGWRRKRSQDGSYCHRDQQFNQGESCLLAVSVKGSWEFHGLALSCYHRSDGVFTPKLSNVSVPSLACMVPTFGAAVTLYVRTAPAT